MISKPDSTLGPIRLVLADDHPVVRSGLKALLLSEPDLRLVGEAGDGQSAVELSQLHLPDVLLLDVSLPRLSGVEVTKRLVALALPTKVLALTAFEDIRFVRTLLDAGALGYALKGSACGELVRAVRMVAQGQIYVDPSLAGALFVRSKRRHSPNAGITAALSEREAEVVRLVARGHTAKEIAGSLGLSSRTLETYKARAMVKLQLTTRAELVRYAARSGWLRDV